MSLASIRKALERSQKTRDAAESKTFDWHGEPVTLTKLSAPDGVRLLALSDGFEKDADNTPTKPDELRKFFEFVVTHTVLEDDGMRAFESDEGKALLATMSLDALADLGSLALDWSGLRVPQEESKKN